MAATSRLRKDLSPAQAHLLLEQIELRRRAKQKFSHAERMFFTPVGLEQSTGEAIARYKAGRLPQDAPAADLCCGIGGDLLSIAGRGPAVGVDLDPVKSLLAEANCRAALQPGADPLRAEVRTADVDLVNLADFACWHIDPDRRATGRRTTRIEAQQPGPDSIARLLMQCPQAAIKLAPAANLPEHWLPQAEREWISFDGECRQLVAWFGNLAVRPGLRTATVVGNDGTFQRLDERSEAAAPEMTGVKRYLFDPDPAVLAGALLPSLCAELDLTALSADGAYLTGDRAINNPLVQCFEVTDVLPFDLRRIKSLLRERKIGRLEIKKRGVPHDPAQLRHKLRVPGDKAATLLIAHFQDAVWGILASRVVSIKRPHPLYADGKKD